MTPERKAALREMAAQTYGVADTPRHLHSEIIQECLDEIDRLEEELPALADKDEIVYVVRRCADGCIIARGDSTTFIKPEHTAAFETPGALCRWLRKQLEREHAR